MRSTHPLASALAAALLVSVTAARADDSKLFERSDQAQTLLQQRLKSAVTPITRALPPRDATEALSRAKARLAELEAVLKLVPSVVLQTRGVFSEYEALLDPVTDSAKALRSAVERSGRGVGISSTELDDLDERARAALSALGQKAQDAYRLGRSRYLREFSLDRPVRLVVSGGVSLGSYQAGVLYYYTRALQHQAQVLGALGLADEAHPLPSLDPRLRVSTGASAGAINAFLAALEMCRTVPADPRKSLLYDTWINVGIDSGDGRSSLYVPDRVTANHVLAEEPLQAAVQRAQQFWDSAEGISPDCRFTFGAPVTPLDARTVDPTFGRRREQTGFKIPVGTEHFFVSVAVEPVKQRDGSSKPALVARPYAAPAEYQSTKLFPQLASNTDGTIPFEAVAGLLRAASAFPVAFAPVQLHYHLVQASEGPTGGEFVDGGIFDNNPLGMAMQLDDWRPSGTNPGRFIFLNSDATNLDRKWTVGRSASTKQDLLGTFGAFLLNYPNVAGSAQLMAALSRDPVLANRLEIPVRRSEVAGEFFSAFTAFLQEDFRLLDFYRGMVDARYSFRAASPLRDLRSDQEIEPSFEHAEIFECFKQYTELGTRPKYCDEHRGEIGDALLALFEATKTPFEGDPSTYLAQFRERLKENGYTFRVTQNDVLWRQGMDVISALRRVGGDAAHRLASRQSTGALRWLVDTAGENGLNATLQRVPAPPFFFLGVTSNGGEVGWSFGGLSLGPTTELRPRAELRFLPYSRPTLADQAGVLFWDAEVGPYAHLDFSYAPWVPWRFSLGLGAGLELIAYSASQGPFLFSRGAIEPSLAVSLLERVELRVGLRIFPRWGQGWLSDIASEPELDAARLSRNGLIFSLDYRL